MVYRDASALLVDLRRLLGRLQEPDLDRERWLAQARLLLEELTDHPTLLQRLPRALQELAHLILAADERGPNWSDAA